MLLGLLPWWARLLAAAALAAAVAWAVHTYNDALRDEGRAEVRAQWQAATDRARAEEEQRAAANRSTARAAEVRFASTQAERVRVVEIVKKEVFNESENLAGCRLDAGDVGMLNSAADRVGAADRPAPDAAGAGLPAASAAAQ